MIGDKTPHYGANLEIILKIWPDAKIINLQRDGINTALSMQRHPAFIRDINGKVNFKNIGKIKLQNKEKYFSNKVPSIESTLLFWKKSINQIDASISNSRKLYSLKLLNIKYEDLVYDTRKTFKLIIKFLNLKSNKFLLIKTICKIKPFAFFKETSKINNHKYLELYKIVKREMKIHKYPYLIKNKNIFFYELPRVFGYYVLNFIEKSYKIYLRVSK